jgi:hypothetical protein
VLIVPKVPRFIIVEISASQTLPLNFCLTASMLGVDRRNADRTQCKDNFRVITQWADSSRCAFDWHIEGYPAHDGGQFTVYKNCELACDAQNIASPHNTVAWFEVDGDNCGISCTNNASVSYDQSGGAYCECLPGYPYQPDATCGLTCDDPMGTEKWLCFSGEQMPESAEMNSCKYIQVQQNISISIGKDGDTCGFYTSTGIYEPDLPLPTAPPRQNPK